MSFLSLTEQDREQMLETIGVDAIDELFEQIPVGVRLGRALELEPALSEPELVAHLTELAMRNIDTGREVSFLGAGIYDHYVPAVVDAVLVRGEFLTAYTPYQPEMSQGVLQAIFEYQTAICELTGMDVSNASGYDGTTVAADACYLARQATGRSKVVLTEAPTTREPCRSRTSTRSRSACSRPRAPTGARSRSAKASRPGTTSRTAARTMDFWRRGPSSSGACRAESPVRPWTPRASAASS